MKNRPSYRYGGLSPTFWWCPTCPILTNSLNITQRKAFWEAKNVLHQSHTSTCKLWKINQNEIELLTMFWQLKGWCWLVTTCSLAQRSFQKLPERSGSTSLCLSVSTTSIQLDTLARFYSVKTTGHTRPSSITLQSCSTSNSLWPQENMPTQVWSLAQFCVLLLLFRTAFFQGYSFYSWVMQSIILEIHT